MKRFIPKGKYAWTVKVGEKGQFVIPKEARDLFDINPGDTIILLGDIKRGMAIPPKKVFDNVANLVFPEDTSELTDDEEEDK